MRKIQLGKVVALLLMACLSAGAEEGAREYSCVFKSGGWDSNDWVAVQSPRWDRAGGWLQKGDHIQNIVPPDATEKEWQGKRAGETYSSLVLKKKVKGDSVVTTTTEFDYRMAPIVVIAFEPGMSPSGTFEYREHFEVCLYDLGINVWHHKYSDGKPSWTKLTHEKFEVSKQEPHKIKVVIKDKLLVVKVDEHEFSLGVEALPNEYYVGITGCEGINKFYDFSLSQ